MENQKALKKVSDKDLRKVFLHSLAIMCSWNYERQMHMGFMYGMAPVLDKLYADDEERKKEAYQRHMEFFNCTPQLTPFIMGLAASMEEQNANSEEGEFQTESISMIKTSLMGPFAGIGDSFFWGTFRVIGVGVGAPLAVAGNILGPILYFLINFIPSEIVRRVGFKIGYEGGSEFLTRISEDGTLNKLTEAARIMGLVVIGAMMASMVNVNLVTVLNINGAQVVLQEIFDAICPKILPLGLTFACYWGLQKRYSGTVIMIALLVLGVLAVALGLL